MNYKITVDPKCVHGLTLILTLKDVDITQVWLDFSKIIEKDKNLQTS